MFMVYVCIYIYIYIHVFVYVFVYVYIYIYLFIYLFIYFLSYLFICIFIFIFIHVVVRCAFWTPLPPLPLSPSGTPQNTRAWSLQRTCDGHPVPEKGGRESPSLRAGSSRLKPSPQGRRDVQVQGYHLRVDGAPGATIYAPGSAARPQ